MDTIGDKYCVICKRHTRDHHRVSVSLVAAQALHSHKNLCARVVGAHCVMLKCMVVIVIQREESRVTFLTTDIVHG